MTTMFTVQDGVPLPSINRASKNKLRKYPLESMSVGAMFFVPGRSSKSVSAYISRIAKDRAAKFTARHCWMKKSAADKWVMCKPEAPGATEGTGVWRVS